jgi:hypothetical protein
MAATPLQLATEFRTDRDAENDVNKDTDKV